MFIDTHAHLYHKQFDADRTEMLARAVDAGVGKLFLPNIDLESVDAMHALAAAHPDLCFPMMGLHPSSVTEDPARDLAGIEKLLREGRYYAVGEIGIDLYWDKTRLAQQQEAFRKPIAYWRPTRPTWRPCRIGASATRAPTSPLWPTRWPRPRPRPWRISNA